MSNLSNESELQPSQMKNRPDFLNGRLNSQARTLAVLLEQAFKIKEEVAASLQSSQAEALSRRLLESHILTITTIVKQLSLNVQTLERQMAQRDSVTSGTTQAVQYLDHKNMAGVGDLRGRVARCDASIANLSANVNAGERHAIRLQQEVTQLRSAVDVMIKELEVKLHRDLGRLEVSLAEVSQRQKSFMSDVHNQVKQLETQFSAKMMEVLKQSNVLRKWTEQQLHCSVQSFEQRNHQLHDKTREAECRLLDRLHALEARVERFETLQDFSIAAHADQLKRMETKLSKRMTSMETSLHHELQLLKQKYHKGFKSVQDTIESLKDITDLQSRLEKGKIQKQIDFICRSMGADL